VAVDGRVVGINYAGNNQTDESFAITAIDAIPIIEQLAAGQDRESLGINAQAMLFEDGSDGVFVQSVETGSPADQAGIEAGDLLLTIEGVSAASDGTMAGYCSILRSKGSESPLKVALYRPSTGEMLEGRINAGEQVQVTGRATGIAGGTDGGSTDGGSTEGSVVIDHEGGRLRIPATMAGWEIRRITLAGQEMLVSVADDDTKISTGLVGTPSPFDLDGVLFVYPSQSTRHFWSLDARFPLDFGFFRSDGSLVTVYRSTAPCLAEPCPRYPAIAQYVVATPGGALDEVAEGAVLVP
jgi:uncharacterized membrane protein (UPF0127 family)